MSQVRKERRSARGAAMVVFMCSIAVGVLDLRINPANFALFLPLLLEAAWAAWIIVGGLLGLVAVVWGQWWIERIAIPVTVTPLLILGVCLTVWLIQGRGDVTHWTTLVTIVGLAASMIRRWQDIQGLTVDPLVYAKKGR